jgi:hypothetical protein
MCEGLGEKSRFKVAGLRGSSDVGVENVVGWDSAWGIRRIGGGIIMTGLDDGVSGSFQFLRSRLKAGWWQRD